MEHKAKKSLGQNFLKSEVALRKIVEVGEIKNTDIILEIGPGKGALTEKLLPARNASRSEAGGEKAKLVIAVEKDWELFEFLKNKFSKQIISGSLVLVHDDILEFNISEAVLAFSNGLAGGGTWRSEDLRKSPKLLHYKVIANIPYNITGAILKKFLTAKEQPALMVLMVQSEVAKRIMARGGKESILSISVKAYGEPKVAMKVPARYFSPHPKIDSAVITIKNISRDRFVNLAGRQVINEEKFWKIVKAGFAHKRKKLSSNLKSLYKVYQGLPLVLENFGNKRAEDLSLADWIYLAKT